jgi:DNA-directed RNA polymerase subunit RPC12/RpoP
MKILHCDSCHAEVNDYGHWYDDKKSRNMYELKCVHESNSDTYDGMIFCHECIAKLLYKAERSDKE